MQRLILFLTAIVLFGIAGFALIWFGTGRDLQGPSVAYLVASRDGDFAAAHAGMHPAARARWSPDELERLWDHWGAKYGEFGEVVRRIGVRDAPDGSDWDRMLRLDLGFRKGHVIGRLYFKDDGGEPKLYHVALEPRAAVAVPAKDRSRLDITSRKLFDHLDKGEVLAFYDALAPVAQMQRDLTELETETQASRETLGPRKHVDLTSERAEGPRQVQLYALEYERGTQAIEVVHEHAEGAWSVVAFRRR